MIDIEDSRTWVLPQMLAVRAASHADKRFVQIVDGDALTFAEAAHDADKVAGHLLALGVSPGDKVAVFVRNSLDFVRAWTGLGRLAAVCVLLNTELKGAFLAHQLENCGAAVAIVGADLLPVLADIAPRLSALRTVLVAEDEAVPGEAPSGWNLLPFSGWRRAATYDGPMPQAHDIAAIMYTSGTTGPAKGVLMPQAHCFLFGFGAVDCLKVSEADTYYIVLPLFHANGLFMQLYACLIAGATAVVRRRFSAAGWLNDVQRYGATITNALGVVSAFVVDTPPRPDDRDHKLRLVLAAPNPAEHVPVWRERFGIAAVSSGFGMTEVNIVAWGSAEGTLPGSAGKPYDRFFEVSIRDPQTDAELAIGDVGEIMVRPRLASGFMAGYHAMPDKTVEAWRNLWFHTGDAGRIDTDGYLHYVDRIKDCIRRRGENISSFEVEQVIAQVPGVAEVAAFAVPATLSGGEDEVMLAVIARPGARLTPEDIARHADPELPRFALPRYIEIVDALPKTPTEKVRKAELRRRGIGPATWDRELAKSRSA
ncbi:AMP-binding protein [Chelatococcus reniformis]|uniref:ATP-dependent acyl-CoA ligase n=1 Tax=Chelatococcus reniformis TaxID=1494448 RepID=A0A916XC71_9HYPH|nr:AMP-binding protein [Chelatococcus reniformis]GGC63198.1 ATP-dependent acyl-CoA ligase [Chelatococcus reniformis]